MNKEKFGSLFFISVGLYGILFAIGIPMGTWRNPGPGIFPLVLSLLLCLLGTIIFFAESGAAKVDWRQVAKRAKTPMQITLITVGFIYGLERIRYLLATSLYLFVLLFWVGRHRWWHALLLTVVIGFLSWWFFGKFLGIQLPRSLLNL